LLGSVNLAQPFMQLALIDEYRININPIVLGRGKRFFADMTREYPLKLLEAKTFKSGVVALRYELARWSARLANGRPMRST
jgi:dihydrofolate reductase